VKSSTTAEGQYVNAWVGNATSHRNCGAGHSPPATHATSATGTGPGESTINRHNADSTTPPDYCDSDIHRHGGAFNLNGKAADRPSVALSR
jgi:hypothetical protein